VPTFNRFRTRVRFDTRLVGGIPVVPEGADRADAYEQWARGQGVDQPASAELAGKLADDDDMPTTDEVEGMETGFRRDDDGIYIEARQVKAMLRESAQRLGIIKQVRGSRQVVQHDLHVRAADGTQKLRPFRGVSRADKPLPVDGPDGKDSRPISVVTRQGPRTAIKRFEYVTEAELEFDVLVLAGGVGDGLVDEAQLREMLEFGGMLGLGADRSQGEGTFTVEEFHPVAPEEDAAA
jgi:hypothetical protein